MADRWDSALYEDRHSFVWEHGAELIDLLDPKPGERVLDLGCGTGHLTARIAERGAVVTGLDASVSMIAQARQNYPKLKFVLADARGLPGAPCRALVTPQGNRPSRSRMRPSRRLT